MSRHIKLPFMNNLGHRFFCFCKIILLDFLNSTCSCSDNISNTLNSFLLLLLFRWTETAQAQRDQERANDIDEINYRNNQKLLAEKRERDSRENRDSAPGKNKFNFIILFFKFTSFSAIISC